MDQKTPEVLTSELSKIALAALNAYLHAPPNADGDTPIKIESELDRKRVALIENKLRPLLAEYLKGTVSAIDFKRRIDGINKQNNFWGFKGIKGQMFFNQLLNTADDASECDRQLKALIREPANEDEAATLLRNFRSYVIRIGEQFLAAGGEPRSRPKPSSIPFFASYFWQIQRREIWPVYYTSTVQMIEGMNLWQATGEIDDDYLAFKRLHERLIELFSAEANKPFSLYDVEHVFWFKSRGLIQPTRSIR
jgi:hypothetical protein